MEKKKITLEDGRYLVYYSFDRNGEAEEEKKEQEKCCEGECCGGKK